MNPQAQFCPNLTCSASGRVGAGNIRIHCHADGRYYCTMCRQRFNAMAGTPMQSRATARLTQTLTAGMYLVGCVYNVCRCHDSLAVELVLPRGRRWLKRTPAIAAGLTDHCWSVAELLSFKIVPPPHEPPKPRSRPTKAEAQARSLFAHPPR